MRWLLHPFTLLYGLIASLRNALYDRGVRRAYRPAVPTVGVGNLTVGGTGKTPHVEYLVRLLAPNYRVATLSRGYRRQTRGYRLATPADSAATLGDEPYQFYRKFGAAGVAVAVGERRAPALAQLRRDVPATEAVLLDDVYQHRAVRPALSVLLTDYRRPFYADYPFPGGRLREPRRGAARADAVVVTKCPPTLPLADQRATAGRVARYTAAPVFFTTVRYGTPQPVAGAAIAPCPAAVVLFSGLARADAFRAYAVEHFAVREAFDFPDHHPYGAADFRRLAAAYDRTGAGAFLTTEKDAVKLVGTDFAARYPVFYLPIEVAFLRDQAAFDALVRRAVANYSPPRDA